MADQLKEPTYIGRAPCGCVLVAISDDPEYKAQTAKDLAKLIRSGFSIERVEAEAVRQSKGWFRCPHRKQKVQREQPRLDFRVSKEK